MTIEFTVTLFGVFWTSMVLIMLGGLIYQLSIMIGFGYGSIRYHPAGVALFIVGLVGLVFSFSVWLGKLCGL